MVTSNKITPPSIGKKDVELVERQLEKILASTYFNSAKQMQRFLRFIVEKTVSGDGELLKQYTIGIEALSFPDDFDPDSNPAVRIMGGRVRVRLKEYYDQEGCHDELIINIPIGTYTPAFKKNRPIVKSPDDYQGKSRGPKLALVSFSDKTQRNDSNRLLFQITDTLAKDLSRSLFSQLIVCNPYADKNQSHLVESEMKAESRADYILALYVQQLPKKKYELLYRLTYVDSGQILSSESYAVNNQQPIEEQDHILSKIMVTIADIRQGILHRHWTRKLLENQESIPLHYQVLAYNRFFIDNLDRGAFAKTAAFCLEALNRNSTDVIANVLYASYCRYEYVFGYGVIESPLKSGRECAERAISLEPNSHEAHFYFAKILFCQKNWKRSYEEFTLARTISKYHSYIEFGAGFHFCLMNKWEEGLPLVKKVMSLSSSYPPWYHVALFLDYYRREKYEDALSEAQQIISSGIVHGPLARCAAYAQLGKLHKARQEYQEVLRRYPNFMKGGIQNVKRFLGSEILAEKIWDGVLKASNGSK